jgi:hypothetical protein
MRRIMFAAFDAYGHGPTDVTEAPSRFCVWERGCLLRVVNALGACKTARHLGCWSRTAVSGDAIAAIVSKGSHRAAVDGLIFTPASAPVGGRYLATNHP